MPFIRRSLVCWLLAAAWLVTSLRASSLVAQESLRAQIQTVLDEEPYRTAHWGLLFTDLQSGVIRIAFADTGTTLPLIKAGRLRALGVKTGEAFR